MVTRPLRWGDYEEVASPPPVVVLCQDLAQIKMRKISL